MNTQTTTPPEARGPLYSWRAQPPAVRLLRGFLGGTFAYAGVQKLIDPGYLSRSSPTFIGTQLKGFAIGSPVGWLLHLLMHFPIVAGIGIALVEIAIGLGTLMDVAPITMSLGGAAISLVLWLSATWHVHPYFLGSDSVYAVAWAAYAMSIWRRPVTADGERSSGEQASTIGRRELLRSAGLSGLILTLGGSARLLERMFGSDVVPMRQSRVSTPSAASSPNATAPRVEGRPIIALDKLKVGAPVGFNGPAGEPAVLLRLNEREVVAYSRVCTHAGCTVGYDASSDLLVCPCHLARFDPRRGAIPISGPTSVPLPEIAVAIDPSRGKVVMPDATG